ncbi:MAG: TIGR03905 family TSCPD domain-containing protein [Eggerthellaceae bacterium]|nr:TIGR03905 family TSCPD domain-containing protein [Eggerthellaceae bacterium]
MAHHQYMTRGTCAKAIDFDIEDGKLHNVQFFGGCNGNLKAIGRLIEGAEAAEIADLLRGNTCGPRSTSCADQLSCAIDKALAEA